ncbi:MAG: Maf family protein [Pseudomonadota bacterium]
MTRLILASGSAARARMLRDAGVPFEVIQPDVDEDAVKNTFGQTLADAERIAAVLARRKALSIKGFGPEVVVLGSDQVLASDDGLFDKPRSLADAKSQLRVLRGKTHRLISSATLVKNGAVVWSGTDIVSLAMRPFSDVFLDEYIAAFGDLVLTSVGGYHIEGLGAQLFERIDGDLFSVQGLPLLQVLGALRKLGILTK